MSRFILGSVASLIAGLATAIGIGLQNIPESNVKSLGRHIYL